MRDSGSAAGGWVKAGGKKKWVLRDKSSRGQGDELCSGSKMIQRMPPWYDPRK